jgi:hypothetical protein
MKSENPTHFIVMFKNGRCSHIHKIKYLENLLSVIKIYSIAVFKIFPKQLKTKK